MAPNPILPEYVRAALAPSIAFDWFAQAVGPITIDRTWTTMADLAGDVLGTPEAIPGIDHDVHVDTVAGEDLGYVDTIYDGTPIALSGIADESNVEQIAIFVDDGSDTIVAIYTRRADSTPVALETTGDDLILTFPRGYVLRCVTG